MRNFGLLVFLTVFLSLISTAVFAQTTPQYGDISGMVKFILGNPNVPADWLVLPNIIYFIVFPFIAIVAVLYGILTEVRIFRGTNVKFILSFVMAGMALPSGILVSAVYWLYLIDTTLAIFAFAALFFVGTIFWALGRGSQLKTELYDLQTELGRLKEESMKLDREYAESKTMTEKEYLEKKAVVIAKYKDRQNRLQNVQAYATSQ